MRYFKLVSEESIVDVVCEADASWIVENPHNYSTYIGRRERARGVLSSDGKQVWHLDGELPFHDFPDYPTVQMIEVEEVEYASLLEELTANGALDAEEEPMESMQPEDTEPKPAKSAALAALEAKVAALAEENARLQEQISMILAASADAGKGE